MEIGKLFFSSFVKSMVLLSVIYILALVLFPVVATDPKFNTPEEVREMAKFVLFAWYYMLLVEKLQGTYKIRMRSQEHGVIYCLGFFFLVTPLVVHFFFWEIPLLVSLMILTSVISLAEYQHRVTEIKKGRVHA